MSDRPIRVAPSLLAADAADLRGAVLALEKTVEIFHVDVMDGHFVPNISMGPAVVEGLRGVTDHVLDVHLMVAEPDRWIEPYRRAGADWISVHAEATVHLERTLRHIRETGARAGVALNPATEGAGLDYVLEEDDFIVVMSVNPGFGGQRFLRRSLDKLAGLRASLEQSGFAGVELEVDGGVGPENAADCAAAGASILVAGSSVLRTPDPAAAARTLLELAVGATA